MVVLERAFVTYMCLWDIFLVISHYLIVATKSTPNLESQFLGLNLTLTIYCVGDLEITCFALSLHSQS